MEVKNDFIYNGLWRINTGHVEESVSQVTFSCVHALNHVRPLINYCQEHCIRVFFFTPPHSTASPFNIMGMGIIAGPLI